jgi:peptidoglycan/LPS O-acetylase OafA/YrhL
LWQWAGAPPWRALDNSALRRIGLLSYSLFLVHGLFLFGLAPHLVVGGYKLTLLALGAVALTGSLIAAALIYRFVERPALNLKTRSTLPPVRPPAPVAGEVAGLGSSAA